jgi:hypothetical protein
MKVSRRQFGRSDFGWIWCICCLSNPGLRLETVDNPLAVYPHRVGEAYRDLWNYDSTFTFTCAQ